MNESLKAFEENNAWMVVDAIPRNKSLEQCKFLKENWVVYM